MKESCFCLSLVSCDGTDRYCCSKSNGKCKANEGGCLNDHECIGDLRCGYNNCGDNQTSNHYLHTKRCCYDSSSGKLFNSRF